MDAVELVQEEPDIPCESKSLDDNAKILNLDRRCCAAADRTSEGKWEQEMIVRLMELQIISKYIILDGADSVITFIMYSHQT